MATKKKYGAGGMQPDKPLPWYKQPSSQWPTSQKPPAPKPGVLSRVASEAKAGLGFSANYWAAKAKGVKAALTPSHPGGSGHRNVRSQLGKLGRY